MLSIDGRTVHIVTEKDGAPAVAFTSAEEARAAMDEWMLGSRKTEEQE